MRNKLIILCVCLSIVIGVLPALPVSSAENNIAFGKPVTASNYYNDKYKPECVVDGDTKTSWSAGSVNLAGRLNSKIFIMVDLLKTYDINSISVRSRRDVDQVNSRRGWMLYGTNSDEFKSYELLGMKSEPGEHMSDLEVSFDTPKSYRYIWLMANSNIVISEIEVYGTVALSSDSKTYDDIKDDKLLNAYSLINYLNLMEPVSSEEFGTHYLVTRGEAAKIALAFLNYEPFAYAHSYSDVTAEHKYAKEIAACLHTGIVSNAAEFRPDEYITGTEFISMLLNALGYSADISLSGGYPFGVLTIANNLKLTRGIDFELTQALNRGNMLLMLYNALIAPASVISSVSANGDYKTNTNSTMLEKTFKLKLYEGVVTENNVTGLKLPGKKSSSHIKIGNMVLTDNSRKLGALLGYDVMYLIHNDKPETVVHGWERYGYNTVESIDADDVYSLKTGALEVSDSAGSINKFFYDSNNVFVLKNGIAFVDYDGELTFEDIKYGSLELIDNNRDGIIDVIHIMKPHITYADYVEITERTVKIIGSNNVSINENDVENIYVYNHNNKLMDGSDLSGNTLLYIYISDDKNCIFIKNTGKKLSGTVDGFSEEYITINNKDYEFSKYYIDHKADMQEVKLNLSTTFVLNSAGKIVWVLDESDINKKIAFVSKVCVESGLSGRGQIALYTEDNKFIELFFAKSVKIDGTIWSNNKITSTINSNSGYFSNKFVFYETNPNNEIIFMDTENYDASNERDSKMVRANIDLGTNALRSGNGIYSSHYMLFPLKTNTKMFVIPTQNSQLVNDDNFKKYYSVSTVQAQFTNGLIIDDNCRFYGMDEFGYPLFAMREIDVSITSKDISSISSKDPFCMIVQKIAEGINDSGENCYILYGYDLQSKNNVKYFVDYNFNNTVELGRIYKDTGNISIPQEQRPSISWFNSYGILNMSKVDMSILENYIKDIKDIKCGDIIVYEQRGDEISEFSLAFSPSSENGISMGVQSSIGSNYNSRQTSPFKLKGGILEKVKNGISVIKTSDTTSEVFDYANLGGTLYIVENNRLYQESLNNIPSYAGGNNQVIIYSDTGVNKAVIIYK